MSIKVKFIGTGQMQTKRKCTSFVVNDSVLFEIGSGIVGGLVENGLDIENISAIVVSHFHADHFGDIVYFLHRRAILGHIQKTLTIIGPQGLQKKVIDFNNFLFGDIRDFGEIASAWNIKFVELGDRKTASAGGLEVEAFKVKHGSVAANGYVIRSGSRAVGYTGDACMSDGILDRIPSAKNWIVDANEMMRRENFHIGFSEIIGLADAFKDIAFYAVHRKDYDTSSAPINLVCPIDGDEFFAK